MTGQCPQDCTRPCGSCDICPACGKLHEDCRCPPEAFGPSPICPACGGRASCDCTPEEVDEWMSDIAGESATLPAKENTPMEYGLTGLGDITEALEHAESLRGRDTYTAEHTAAEVLYLLSRELLYIAKHKQPRDAAWFERVDELRLRAWAVLAG